jgi:hypothetical protein
MKAWRPRPASAGLRSRIFASKADRLEDAEFERGAERGGSKVFEWAGLMRWLVPAMGCFVLATATLVEPGAPAAAASFGSLERQGIAVSMASQYDFNRKNSVPATTLEWTFGRQSYSSNDSLAGSETNLLSK